MKVYLNGYPEHWLSPYTIIDYVFFWTDWSKCSRRKGYVTDEEFVDHPDWVETWVKRLDPFCQALMAIRKVINPTIRYVKIDYHDTWSMDHTLAYIITPMLKQLRDTKHGYGMVDDEDVPEELKSHNGTKENDYDWDSNAEARYDYILNEMIWAFERLTMDDDTDQFYDHSESKNCKDFMESFRKLKVDREGLNAHEARKQNGFRLFGKYFSSLWD